MRIPFFILITFLTAQPSRCQDAHDYFIYYNFATSPGLMGFNGKIVYIKNDSLSVCHRVNSFYNDKDSIINVYDTSVYKMATGDVTKIEKKLARIDSTGSHFNLCIIDGFRFYYSFDFRGRSFSGWVGHAYDETIYYFFDIANRYLPEKDKIFYGDKETLIRDEKKCMDDFLRRPEKKKPKH